MGRRVDVLCRRAVRDIATQAFAEQAELITAATNTAVMSEKRKRQEAAVHDGGRGRNTERKSRKKDTKIMEQSNQTVEERREVRQRQKDLKETIDRRRDDIANVNKDTCSEMLRENAEIGERVHYSREAVGDMANVKGIAEAAAKQANYVNRSTTTIDIDKFLQTLRERMLVVDDNGSDEFGWRKFGTAVGGCFHCVPSGGGFMMGPLDKAVKERKAWKRRQHQEDEDTPEVIPEQVVADPSGKKTKHKDQTELRIASMRAHCARKEDIGKPKDMFQTLLNPKSFTQSVENLFDFSFFIKKGDASVEIDQESKLPQITFEHTAGDGTEAALAPKQWLLSFTPADFRELAEQYNMKKSNLKHRDEGPTSDYFDPLVDGNRKGQGTVFS